MHKASGFTFQNVFFPFRENANSVSRTIFKSFSVSMLDFAGED